MIGYPFKGIPPKPCAESNVRPEFVEGLEQCLLFLPIVPRGCVTPQHKNDLDI